MTPRGQQDSSSEATLASLWPHSALARFVVLHGSLEFGATMGAAAPAPSLGGLLRYHEEGLQHSRLNLRARAEQ